MNIFVHGASATPTLLLEALCRRADLTDIQLYHMHTAGPAPFVEPECRGRITSVSLFTGPPVRKAIQSGYADFIPVFLSDIPDLFRSGLIRLDAALLHLSPPDRQGYCSLGTSVDVARAAADSAPLLIAEVNRQMPRTHGDSSVPLKSLTAYTQTDCPLHEHPASEETPVEAAIGEQIAKLIEDGATIQTGIGSIPDAVLSRLTSKHDLGIHTEMVSDGIIQAVESGIVNGSKKNFVFPGLAGKMTKERNFYF